MAGAYVSGAASVGGDSYAPASGTDTALVWLSVGYGTGLITASGQTFNSISMVETQDNAINLAGNGDPFANISHLVAPGATSQALATTFSSTPVVESGFALTLSGIDQTTPVYATNGNVSATYTTDLNPALTYDAPADSVIIYYKQHRGSGTPTFTAPSGFTEFFSDEQVTSPANITVKAWYKEQSTLVTSATVSAAVLNSTGGVHGVMVYQAAAGGGGIIPLISHHMRQMGQ